MTDIEKRILAKTLEIGVKQIMKNHLYQFNGITYRQGKGGAIGLRLTGTVARIIMDRWAIRMTSDLESNLLNIYLLTKYVDDINIFMEAVKVRSRLIGNKIVVTEEYKQKDITDKSEG